ncbi:Nramp family divalent metal transporter [Candidatus Poribacteria bacterium]|nr:Nramp family divalent metal transporter [Candidatus Poribacteria bacterium]
MTKIYEPLADFKMEDLPEKKLPFWKIVGPGAILVGLSIGAGEIIIWPRIVAQFGASMVWAAVVGVFLQLWVNFEIGRWTIATGETVYTGYSRVWRGFAPLFILLTLLGWLAPGWGRASGLALKALLVGPTGWGSDTFWTVITFAAVALLLFGPKLIYHSVERTIELLVAIIAIGLIMVMFAVGSADIWRELGAGIVNIGYRDAGMSVKDLFIAIVFAGAGGTANLFYTFYLRDKHIGMGARLPELQNPLRGRTEKSPVTGFRFEETAENRNRFNAWWGYVKKDQVLFFWGLNTFTILLFIFGSLAVLHPKGLVPAQGSLIWDEAQVLSEVWGKPGRTIFLLVGVATLFSTQLALVDGVARSIADIVYTNFKGAQKRDLSWWYLLVAGVWMVAGCLITYVMERKGVSELGFLFNAAYMGGFAMAIYVPLMLYINHRFLPKTAKPGFFCTLMMSIASLVYIGFAVYCIVWEIGKRMG